MKQKLVIPQRKALVKRPSLLSWSRRSKITIVVLGIVSLVSLGLLVFPYLPHISFLFRHKKIDPAPYQQAAQNTKKNTPNANKPEPALTGNRLIMPGIGVNAQIIEGREIWVIGHNQGVWRESRSIDPTKNGNIVIAGHRFIYSIKNQGWFYNLPELKYGDHIYIKWNDKTYEYEIYNSRTVLPSQVDIRDNDPKVPKKLTMYTCYPLGSTSKRFVIEAKQI